MDLPSAVVTWASSAGLICAFLAMFWLAEHAELPLLEAQVESSRGSFSGAVPRRCTPTTAERFRVVLTLWVKKLIVVQFSSVSHGHKSNQGPQLQVQYSSRPCCPFPSLFVKSKKGGMRIFEILLGLAHRGKQCTRTKLYCLRTCAVISVTTATIKKVFVYLPFLLPLTFKNSEFSEIWLDFLQPVLWSERKAWHVLT